MLLLFIASFITAGISSITGMAGGVVLLSLMTLSLPMAAVIPIHGMVQLFSNSLRVFYLRKDLNITLFRFFLFGMPLGATLALFFLKDYANENWILSMLAGLISYSILKPKKLPSLKIRPIAWSAVGFFAGILALLIGSVGPFLALFFVREDLSKEEIISTKASMQLTCHIIKIPSFLYIGFNYKEYSTLTVFMILGALLGTKIGILLLKKIDNKVFRVLFKLFLAIALVRILFKLLS